MKILENTESGLIAAFIISDIASFLLLMMNIFYKIPGEREIIPIFLIIMPAVYMETNGKLEVEKSRDFQYKKVLCILLLCLVFTESMNIILFVL